jgi:hypothetical protein
VCNVRATSNSARPFPRTGEIAIFANFTKSTGSLQPLFFCLFYLLRMARLLHLELLAASSPAEVHTIKERVMAKVIEFYVPKNFRNEFVCVPVSPNRERLSSFLRRLRSQSRLDQLVGSSGGSWQRRSRTML